MTSLRGLACGAAFSALALGMSTAAYAQETTGSIRGLVTDEAGAPVANATVTVTHVPTGSTSTQVTGPEGAFSARGLRVGGPYRLSASAAGFETGGVTIASISLGDPTATEISLFRAGSATVSELVVEGAAAAAPSQGGPSSNFSARTIETLPSISRDLKDVARLDPFATIQDPTNQDAMSFGGANTRFNQLTVDGVRQNDDFGLNNNGYPTQRSPISLDAVAAVNVSIAPFSVINNGFTGGQINAVTKSGGNNFFGSLFYERSGRDWQGKTVEGVETGAEFEEKTWGATLGGPILRDRAFFFLSYEKFDGLLGFDEGPVGSDATVTIPRITTQALETFRADTQRIYNYDPGSYVTGSFPVSDEKYLAKIDLNITDNHRAALTYQKTLGNALNGSTSSTFAQGNSLTQPRVGLTSGQYDKLEELETYTVQLNSDWTENFSTELRYAKKLTDTQQNPLGGLAVGEVTVRVADLPGVQPGAGTPEIRFGADINRHDNYLNVKVDTFEAIGRYHSGIHDLLFGFRTEEDQLLNVFVASSLGQWTFNSYADFLNRRAGRLNLTGGVNPAAGTVPAALGTARLGQAEFGFRLSSVYAEDRIRILPNLDVSAGVRMDWYSMDDKPILNTNFQSRHGFTNQTNLDGKYVVLPRVFFNWEPLDRLKVSGGIGRFSSTGLNVWISNAFSNTGVTQTNAICPAASLNNVDITKAPAGCTFTPGSGNTNALHPSFQIPTVWKGTLSVGYTVDLGRFGDDWLVQADYAGSVNQNALYWYDARAVQTGRAPDGRPVYGRSTTGVTTGNSYDFLLSNIDKGQSQSVAFTVAKDWDEGLFDGLGMRYTYTFTDAEEVSPMTSSIALSSYTRFGTADPQRPSAETSDYEIRHAHKLTLNYAKKFFGDNETSLHLFAQHRSGVPFSYAFGNSRTGDFDNDFGYAVSSYSGRQATSNALLYVPTPNDPKVVYGPNFNQAAFQAFLQESGLAEYAGRIAPRNAFRHSDVTTFDLRVSQEFPGFFPSKAKFEVYMDLENIGNMLNDDWGVIEQYDFSRQVPVVDVSCVTAAGAAANCGAAGALYRYQGLGPNGTFTRPVQPFRREQSLWQVKLGARFKF